MADGAISTGVHHVALVAYDYQISGILPLAQWRKGECVTH